MKKSVLFFFVLIVLLLATVIVLQITRSRPTGEEKLDNMTLAPVLQKEYANILFAKGIKAEAARVYEHYLQNAQENKKELAPVAYRVGTIYMDLFEYEKALAAFYQAELLDPEGSFKEEMNQKIVEALENLGLSTQAQYELEARTGIGKTEKKEGIPVARVGARTITYDEIDKALAQLPEWMRSTYDDEDKKKEFIREYVSHEVLYRKAKRLGLDKTPEARETMHYIERQFLVAELLDREVNEKVQLDKKDLELYYKANKERYADPAGVQISFLECSDSSKKDEIGAALTEGKEKAVWLHEGDTTIPGIGEGADTVATLLTRAKGSVTDLMTIHDTPYIFCIVDKQERRQKPFEEVQKQIEYELRQEKQNELTQKLLEKALEEQEVELYELPSEKKDTNEK